VISRRLTEAMGGDLGVSQNDRVGTTFTFTAVLGVSTERRAPAPGQSAGSLVGKLALIVDDNLTNRRVLQLLLQDFGMICTKVASPAAALELLATGARFDVAVLDMHMPDMDGQQLAVALRALPAGRDLPLVLLTSLQWRSDSAHRSLFVATLTKPAKSNVLQEKLLSAVAPGEAALLAVETIGGRRSRDAPANTEDSLHVLVAEDNPVNQRVAQLMLAQLGHRVDIVGNGREAVEAVRRTSYDVVLMDVRMPQLDGMRAAEMIRTAHGLPAADHRRDRERVDRGPGGVCRRRAGRLSHQTDPDRGADRGAGAGTPAGCRCLPRRGRPSGGPRRSVGADRRVHRLTRRTPSVGLRLASGGSGAGGGRSGGSTRPTRTPGGSAADRNPGRVRRQGRRRRLRLRLRLHQRRDLALVGADGRDEAADGDEIYPTPPRPTASCQPNGAPLLGGGMATRVGETAKARGVQPATGRKARRPAKDMPSSRTCARSRACADGRSVLSRNPWQAHLARI